jgi:hypothetical protein
VRFEGAGSANDQAYVMRPSDREQAIAVAEAHVRGARIGEPQLLNAEYRAGDEPMPDSAEQRLRSLGATDAHVEKLKEIWRNRTTRPRWEIRFLLHDQRYADGITIAFVDVDDATGRVGLRVFERGGAA